MITLFTITSGDDTRVFRTRFLSLLRDMVENRSKAEARQSADSYVSSEAFIDKVVERIKKKQLKD